MNLPLLPELPGPLPSPSSPRWQLLRAGIHNVWEYDDQRFVFHKGRLLLRGQNESGKTKALEVLLPFLLDASLQPQRLDPFGSAARPMRWNLLNDGNAEVAVAIGYVWVELGRLDGTTPVYCTAGCGLRAKRSTPSVDDWYFLTELRQDESLHLLGEGRIPLTRPHLEEALRGRGEVFDKGSDYRRAVNARLFGLPDDQYGAMVDALLQLRRPQLSKQLDPDELSRLLGESLPPLDGNVVGTLAEGFERLDRHRHERDEAAATLDAVGGFLSVYRGYVGSFARARAQGLTSADSAFHAAREAEREAERARDDAQARQRALGEELSALDREAEALAARLETLRTSEDFRAIEALAQAERQAAQDAEQARGRSASRALERAKLGEESRRVEESEREASRVELGLGQARDEARARAAAATLGPQHQGVEVGGPGGRAALELALRLRDQALQQLGALARVLDAERQRANAAGQRLADAEARAQDSAERLDAAEREERRAREGFAGEVEAWRERLSLLSGVVPALAELAPSTQRDAVERAAEPVRAALEQRLAQARVALDGIVRQLAQTALERDSVASQKDLPPPAPPWRAPRPAERPGAPLFLLCDWRPGAEEAGRAGLEAALEAAGLLDAWVTPDGALLDPRTYDVVLAPGAATAGPSLLELLEPLEAGGASVEVARAVLASIGLGAGEGACWVAPSGRFRVGPLHGSAPARPAAYIGATAREQARQRLLSELEAKLAALRGVQQASEAAVAELVREREALLAELASFPDAAPVARAELAAVARAEELTAARARRDEARGALERAQAAVAQAIAARDGEAVRLELRGWVDRLDELHRRTLEYERAARDLLAAAGEHASARARLEDRRATRAAASERAAAAAREAEEALLRSTRSAAQVAAIRDAMGTTPDALLAEVSWTEQALQGARRTLRDRQEARHLVDQQAGVALQSAESAGEKVAAADTSRRAAEGAFRTAAAKGVLALAGLEAVAPAAALAQGSFTEALLAARRVDEATAKLDPSAQARDRAFARVAERHQELQRTLRADIRVLAEQVEELMLYRAAFSGRSVGMLELVAELEAEVAARQKLLGDAEHALFESFLTGEAHEHLRGRLREATALVRRMNRQLEAHPTSSGMTMRLVWEISEDAPAGSREAVALLLRSGHLLSDGDREALSSFLRSRLDQARRDERQRPLKEQLMAVLDYRRWHGFKVDCRAGAEGWKRLTRKLHAAGSGGQKAVTLHLPLFAAAAAFFDSAAATAPRLILLDEAFAGIDRETRAQLMGLLAEFDLDFVMTSFEEWGFYPQLDGLSTYHLSRERGMRGVHTDWFVWNGREPIHVEAS